SGVGLLFGPICAAILGLVAYRVLVRPLYKRVDPIYSLLMTFGLALVMEDMARTIWGAEGVPCTVPNWLNSPVTEFLFFVTRYRVLVIVITILSTAGLYL